MSAIQPRLVLAAVLLLAAVLVLGAPAGADTAPEDAGAALDRLVAEEWAWRLAANPLLATGVGVHDYDDRLPTLGLADLEREAAARRDFLSRLEAIDRAALETADRVTYDVLHRQLADALAAHRLAAHEIPLTSDSGFHTDVVRLTSDMPFVTAADYERYLARLHDLPRYFAEHTAHMRRGLERGFTLPAVVLEGYDVTIASHVVADPEESLFWRPFADLPEALPEAERGRLAAAGRTAIREAVVPAYRDFLAFMTGEYRPRARTTVGASAMPGGEEYYRFLVRHYTTLDVTPEEVHAIGLAEVERIHGEMLAAIAATGFEGDFAAFLAFLRSDPRFYASTPEELLERAAWIAKSMDGKLPALFATLPRAPYGVEPVPDHLAPKYTAGRYVGVPPGSRRAAMYWVNTHDLPSRPLYTLEALTLHEAVPGHHLQIALAQERDDLPELRRHDYISAFGEGWGLYAERLGLEAGFYTDPYSDFGRLTYEMWRACRLVVDTGLHAMGWSRRQALDYLGGHTALSLHEVATEVDRYISWPGQALAYKMGELKIRELRRRAEETLGAGFDVRDFHDAVLRHGSVPLPVLEELIAEYIAAAAGG